MCVAKPTALAEDKKVEPSSAMAATGGGGGVVVIKFRDKNVWLRLDLISHTSWVLI